MIIILGELRCEHLNEFLKSRAIPKVVWLSEDATKITERVQYDQKTNRLVGLVAPLNEYGLPSSNYYFVKYDAEIESFIKSNNKCTYLYAILAQPVVQNASAFVLCLFGTDNKHVLKRWKYITTQLKNLILKFWVCLLVIFIDSII